MNPELYRFTYDPSSSREESDGRFFCTEIIINYVHSIKSNQIILYNTLQTHCVFKVPSYLPYAPQAPLSSICSFTIWQTVWCVMHSDLSGFGHPGFLTQLVLLLTLHILLTRAVQTVRGNANRQTPEALDEVLPPENVGYLNGSRRFV
jgi:hypothetical protein